MSAVTWTCSRHLGQVALSFQLLLTDRSFFRSPIRFFRHLRNRCRDRTGYYREWTLGNRIQHLQRSDRDRLPTCRLCDGGRSRARVPRCSLPAVRPFGPCSGGYISTMREPTVRATPGLVVSRGKQSARSWFHAQSLKGIAAHDCAVYAAIDGSVLEWKVIHAPSKDPMK